MKFSHANAYSFGKSQKCTLDKTDPLYTPGPGQYQPGILKRSEPKWKIGTAKRGEGRKNTNPGPGNYRNVYAINEKGRYPISNVENIRSFNFVNDKMKRFNYKCKYICYLYF